MAIAERVRDGLSFSSMSSGFKDFMKKLELMQQAVFFVLVIAGVSVLIYLFLNSTKL